MFFFLRALCVLSGSFLFVGTILAAPTLESVFPPGGQRGAKVAVTLAGKWARWPPRIAIDDAAITVEPLKEAGRAAVSIAADAEPGVRYVRLIEVDTISKPVPFVVGTLREVEEVETNDDGPRAQPLGTEPVTVNGRLAKGGDVDQFAVTLKQGQTLVAALAAHEVLGSPVDAILQVADAAGFVDEQNHDAGGLDPLLAFTAPRSGTFAVRVFGFPSDPNSTIAFFGSSKCVYRLTLTTGPFIDHCLPLAVEHDKPAHVELSGWNLPDALRRRSLSAAMPDDRLSVFAADAAGLAWLAVVDRPSVTEQEPNPVDHPQHIELPATVSGRIQSPGDVDTFEFPARKGEKLVVRVLSRSLGFPLDAVLQLTTAQGKLITRSDDDGSQRDPRVKFTVPTDGSYRVRLDDLTGAGGPRYAYRLDLVREGAEFDLALTDGAVVVRAGKTLELGVAVERSEGFAEPITIEAVGLPEGVKAEPVESMPPAAASGKSTVKVSKFKLKLSATAAAKSGAIRIVGRTQSGHTHAAHAPLGIGEETTTRIWLDVAK